METKDIEVEDVDNLRNISNDHIILINAMLVINNYYISQLEKQNPCKADTDYLESISAVESRLYHDICCSILTQKEIEYSVDRPFALPGCLIDFIHHYLEILNVQEEDNQKRLVIPKNKKSYCFLSSEIPCLITKKTEDEELSIRRITEIDNRIYEKERIYSSLFYKHIKLKYIGNIVLDELVILYKIYQFVKERVKVDYLPDDVLDAEKVKKILEQPAFSAITYIPFYNDPKRGLIPNELIEVFLLGSELDNTSNNWYNLAEDLRITADYKPGFTLLEKINRNSTLPDSSELTADLDYDSLTFPEDTKIHTRDTSISGINGGIENLREFLIMQVMPAMKNSGLEMEILANKLKTQLHSLEIRKAVFVIRTVLGDNSPAKAVVSRCNYYALIEAIEFLLYNDYYAIFFDYPEIVKSVEVKHGYLLDIEWIKSEWKLFEKRNNRTI